MEKKFLNLDEAATFLGYTKKYMYQLTMKNILPYSKPGGRKLVFEVEKLEKWLSKNSNDTNNG